MKFTKVFYKSDDFITSIDVFPLNRKLLCCANYSGRVFLYDYERKVIAMENQLSLQKMKSSTSDTEVIEVPHVSVLAFTRDGNHLMCGLESGQIIQLDPNVLRATKSFRHSDHKIQAIKFSNDSIFMVIYVRLQLSHWIPIHFLYLQDEAANVLLFSVQFGEWMFHGKVCHHTKPICDVLFISPAQVSLQPHSNQKHAPRLISLAQDRVSFA